MHISMLRKKGSKCETNPSWFPFYKLFGTVFAIIWNLIFVNRNMFFKVTVWLEFFCNWSTKGQSWNAGSSPETLALSTKGIFLNIFSNLSHRMLFCKIFGILSSDDQYPFLFGSGQQADRSNPPKNTYSSDLHTFRTLPFWTAYQFVCSTISSSNSSVKNKLKTFTGFEQDFASSDISTGSHESETQFTASFFSQFPCFNEFRLY